MDCRCEIWSEKCYPDARPEKGNKASLLIHWHLLHPRAWGWARSRPDTTWIRTGIPAWGSSLPPATEIDQAFMPPVCEILIDCFQILVRRLFVPLDLKVT